MITITSDFECGNARNIVQVSERRFRLEIVGDKKFYNYYFCFDVRNQGPGTDVEVEVRADPAFGDPVGFVVCLPTTLWVRPEGMDRFRPLDQSKVEDCGDHIVVHLSLKENDRVRVTDVWPAPYSDTCAFLRKLADERGDRCELFELGKSVEGREILGIRTGTPGRPKVVCGAGQHAVEFTGTWGMRGLADYVTSLIPDAAALRKELEIEVIPVVNPDGNVAGRNAFNAEGFDMYQAFERDPDAGQPEAHESRLLWRKLVEESPALWMNLHAYVGWRTNSEYPYDGWYEVMDPVFQDPDQARRYRALCDTMRMETEGLSTHGRASVHRPATLCYQMAKRFGIPSAFYEINAATAGPHGAAQRAIQVFKRVTHTLLHF